MMYAPCLATLFLLCLFLPQRCLLLAGDLYPLVLVPGLHGSQLEARLTEAYDPPIPICGARNDKAWFRLWTNYSMLLDSQSQLCFNDQMRLVYDPQADDFRNAPGVQTRVPFFGSTEGFRYRDPDHKNETSYMSILVEHLEGIGYIEGENLFGAPYDFRYGLAASGHNSQVGSQFLQDLRELIQYASWSNGDKPVIILTHSYGGLLTLQLLNRTHAEWRRRFVKHFIPLSAPWGGTVTLMFVFASGYNLGFPFVDRLVMRPESRSSESELWMLPSPMVFGETPLVITKHGNYSASRMSEFLSGIGFSEGVEPYEARILPLVQELPAPQVPVTCMTGTGVETPEVLIYDGEGGLDEYPEIVYGDGDGAVNLISLLAIESQWDSLPEQYLKVVKMPNISHVDIIKKDLALREIMREILDINYGALRSVS